MQPPASWILSEGLAGLQSQALGLAEAAGLVPEMRLLRPRAPWKFVTAKLWPWPLAAVPDAVQPPLPELILSCGGNAAPVGLALRRRIGALVQVQHPRMDTRRFDLIVVNRHDELTGPNVVVTRTALHRVTPERLAAAADAWRERFAAFRRPLVAVLVGGSNGRFRLDAAVGGRLAADLAAMAKRDRVGVVVTPSRRTDPAVVQVLTEALAPVGGWVWDGVGDNPYFAMLALADAIVVTMDSVSMISEAAATTAPVLVVELPGRSRRIGLFNQGMLADGRVRRFAGRFEQWKVAPMNDTPLAGAELRRRLGLEGMTGVGAKAEAEPEAEPGAAIGAGAGAEVGTGAETGAGVKAGAGAKAGGEVKKLPLPLWEGGGGRGRACTPDIRMDRTTPPPIPLPQGEGEESVHHR